jgi:hypothetical protein
MFTEVSIVSPSLRRDSTFAWITTVLNPYLSIIRGHQSSHLTRRAAIEVVFKLIKNQSTELLKTVSKNPSS